MTPLVPCPSCARHVRASESCCPFCKSALDPSLSAVREVPTLRSRAAIAAFSAGVAISGCAPALQQQEVMVVQPQQQVVVQQPDPVVIQQPAPVDPDNTVIVVRPARPQRPVQPQPDPVTIQPPDHTAVVPAYGIAPYDPGGPVARYGAPPPPEDCE